jgi:hypothetical protein
LRFIELSITIGFLATMSKYLLSCHCGATIPVEAGQAGGKVVCASCGAGLDVPTLRKLRHLPQAAIETEPGPFQWSARKGIATAGLMLAAILAVVALGIRFFEPAIPVFDPEVRMQNIDEALEKLSPAQGFQMWVDLYRPMAERGFAILEDPHKPAIERYVARQRLLQKILFVTAAFGAALALAAILWPRPASKR